MSERLGTVVRLQVQAESLKASGIYDPSYLVQVDRSTLSPEGMLGWDGTGWLVDAHHSSHPRPRGGGRRAISVGLSGHYTSMSKRFGDVTLGIGGENIIVEGPELRLPEIADGFTIRRPDGTAIDLFDPRVITPCVEFTSYLLGSDSKLPLDQIGDDLSFLDDGTRGHIVDVDHLTGPVLIEVGDEVWMR